MALGKRIQTLHFWCTQQGQTCAGLMVDSLCSANNVFPQALQPHILLVSSVCSLTLPLCEHFNEFCVDSSSPLVLHTLSLHNLVLEFTSVSGNTTSDTYRGEASTEMSDTHQEETHQHLPETESSAIHFY